MLIIFDYQKALIPTFNTYFSATQYSFRILYLPIQIKMCIEYQKKRFEKRFKKNIYVQI